MPVRVSIRDFRLAAGCVATAALVGVAGCGGLSKTEEAARADAETARQDLDELGRGSEGGWASLRVSRRPWLAIERIERISREKLPVELTGDSAVTLPLSDVGNDAVLAARIEAAAEVGVRLVGPSSGSVGGFTQSLRDGWTPAGGIWTGPLNRLL